MVKFDIFSSWVTPIEIDKWWCNICGYANPVVFVSLLLVIYLLTIVKAIPHSSLPVHPHTIITLQISSPALESPSHVLAWSVKVIQQAIGYSVSLR